MLMCLGLSSELFCSSLVGHAHFLKFLSMLKKMLKLS